MSGLPEPWLRGPVEGVDPRIAPILYTFQQAREDLERYAGSLTPAQLWAKPYGFGSAGFHLLHIANSTDRLMSYLQGRELTREQFAALAAEEKTADLTAADLLAGMDRVFAEAETTVRALDPANLSEPRWVGRKRLPTTVAGLLTHIAEHIQRHIGQAISAAKLARAMESQS
ncbi:MAG TPA: DinB family protein [Bryobacteraceae bacterium]|nr:DinB family protein [Bryobacteraceae bacterium]